MSKTFLRVRCPCCGSLAYPKQLENAMLKPAEVRIIANTIGGKTKGTPGEVNKGRGKGGHGVITFEDVTADQPELVAKYNKWFAERMKTSGLME